MPTQTRLTDYHERLGLQTRVNSGFTGINTRDVEFRLDNQVGKRSIEETGRRRRARDMANRRQRRTRCCTKELDYGDFDKEYTYTDE
jgi:hypothetical protein